MQSPTERSRPEAGHPRVLALGIGVGIGLVATLAPESVDEVLELLVIGQASLLAIVLSVSLLSVQVSTNRYAPMLSQVYREGVFVRIMARFGVSILVAIGLRTGLPLLPPMVSGVGTGVASGLAAWSFLALFALEERLLAFLNPDPTLDRLVSEVSLSRYRSFTRRNREEGAVARNPLLEIFQIAQTSMDQNDNYGTLRAVDALDRATATIVDDIGALPADEQRDLDCVHRLFDYWVQIARTTVRHGADDVLHALVDGLESAGRQSISTTEPHVTTHAVQALKKVCLEAREQRRLEPRYVAALAVFSETDDSEVVDAVLDAAVALEAAGADPETLADVVSEYVDAGYRDVVFQRLEKPDTNVESRDRLRDAVEDRSEPR